MEIALEFVLKEVNRRTRKKISHSMNENQQKLHPFMTLGPGFEPEASAPTIVLSLLPRRNEPSSVPVERIYGPLLVTLHYHYT